MSLKVWENKVCLAAETTALRNIDREKENGHDTSG